MALNAQDQQRIDAVKARWQKRYGASLGELLKGYFKVFQQRPDVVVYDLMEQPVDLSALTPEKMPDDMLAIGAELGRIEFNWVLKECDDVRGDFSKGYNGGRFEFRGLENFRWHPIADWRREYENFEAEAHFDNFVEEGFAVLSYDPGQSPQDATLVFDNANSCSRHPMGSIEDYLRRGARSAFVWYWQVEDWEGADFRQELLDQSIANDTAADTVIELLVKKGLTQKLAQAMVDWLEDDVAILLHKSALSEAGLPVPPKAKASVFALSDQPSTRSMDQDLVKNLAGSAEPVTEEDWDTRTNKHKEFLDSGGAGGNWQTFSVSGMPLCIYLGPEAGGGEQLVARLQNLTGIDASDRDLRHSDLSGALASEVNFQGSDLSHAMMIDSWFEGANFDGATLNGADLSGARMKGASFRDADLSGADFECADLSGADFRGARLKDARFPGAVLDDVLFDGGE